MRTMRWIHAVLAWTMVAAVAAQFFFAGIGIFAEKGNFELHGLNASLIAVLILLTLITAAVTRQGWRSIALHGVLVPLLLVQALLVAAPGWVAALHPLNGTLILLLATLLAPRAWLAARRTPARGLA